MSLPSEIAIRLDTLRETLGRVVTVASHQRGPHTTYRVLYGHRDGCPIDRTYHTPHEVVVALDAFAVGANREIA